ncbi:hypothetical protein [Sphingobium sp. EM0848]|uniref:hypothetical protein n=1 Tax=Sphingobium sp. EM0848 TaxID=2743473 RepID=UPI00159C90C2|nr:hypothetical protein [Sphingobium sp. EM0848]
MATRKTDRPLQRFIDERASGQFRYPQNLHHSAGHDPDRAGWDGMNDPMVRDHAAQNEAIPVGNSEPPPAHPLSASVERFAAGENGGSWGTVRIAQLSNSKTPAEDIPADAALSN